MKGEDLITYCKAYARTSASCRALEKLFFNVGQFLGGNALTVVGDNNYAPFSLLLTEISTLSPSEPYFAALDSCCTIASLGVFSFCS